MSENNQVFDAKFKLGISAAAVNALISADLVGFQNFIRSSTRFIFQSPKQTFIRKIYFFDQGYVAVSSQEAAEMKLLAQGQQICFSKEFSRLDLELLKNGFTDTFNQMYSGKQSTNNE